MEHKRVASENVSDFYYRDNTFFYTVIHIYIVEFVHSKTFRDYTFFYKHILLQS
jgi:hypothetical protein